MKHFAWMWPFEEFMAISGSLYVDVHSPRAFHGLKRIWEYLDEFDLRLADDPHKNFNIRMKTDTKLIAFLLDPDAARSSGQGEQSVQEHLTLSYLAHKYLGLDYRLSVPTIYSEDSFESLSGIIANDALLIFRLADALPALMTRKLLRLYRNLELPLMVVLDDMRRTGIGFDGQECRNQVGRTQITLASLAREISGAQSVDLTSDDDVYRFLSAQGISFPVGPAYVKRWGLTRILEEMAHALPTARKILDFRDLGRDLGFLRRWADQDRIHAVWGQTRSATSRIYARSPALQNISRDLRHLFVPAGGHVLIKADYSQAQMRILARLSGDEELIRIFNDPNGDVHQETSDRLGMQDRNVAKEINFAICFGMGPSALAGRINALKESQGRADFIDLNTAQSYIDAFYDRYPKVREFLDTQWDELKKLAPKQRVVFSLLSRERRFDRRPTAEVERQFRVTWPQQIEADLMKTAMVRLHRIFKRRNMKTRLVMTIHCRFNSNSESRTSPRAIAGNSVTVMDHRLQTRSTSTGYPATTK